MITTSGVTERPAQEFDWLCVHDLTEKKMTRIKLISAAAFIATVVAGPAFAQEAYAPSINAPYVHGPMYYRSYDVPPGSYAPRDTDEYWNERNFGFSGRDPSRTGGVSQNLQPPGNSNISL